jgi:hypothetical protein
MINNEEKYQNLLEQIHELNRANFLNGNNKVEELLKSIDNLEENISKKNSNIFDKKFFILISILLFNILLNLYIIFNLNHTKEVKIISPNKEKVKNLDKNEAIEFNKTNIEISQNEKYEEIKPIIRKGTPYFCANDSEIFKTPYTVEIRGKLYSDKFIFILHENDISKECFIKKENM